MDGRNYYAITGEALEKVVAWEARRKQMRKAAMAFAAKCRAKFPICDTHHQTYRVVGVIFEGTATEGWVLSRTPCEDGDYYVPSRRTRLGKSLQAEMQDLSVDSCRLGNLHVEGRFMHWPAVLKLGKQYILSQHEDAKPPDGLQMMPRSEYYRLLEQQVMK